MPCFIHLTVDHGLLFALIWTLGWLHSKFEPIIRPSESYWLTLGQFYSVDLLSSYECYSWILLKDWIINWKFNREYLLENIYRGLLIVMDTDKLAQRWKIILWRSVIWRFDTFTKVRDSNYIRMSLTSFDHKKSMALL